MEFEVAWATIFKIAFIGILTYVLGPVLLTIRDAVLWWVIRKLLLNNEIMETLSSYCQAKAWLEEGLNTPFKIHGAGKDQKFFLGSEQVSPETFFHQKDHWIKLTDSTSKQWKRLQSVEKRIDRLLKYFKQSEENPLRESRIKLYQSFAQSFIGMQKNQVPTKNQHDTS